MAEPGERRSARDAVDDFIRHLADGGFAVITRRIRRHFLSEYLHHAQQAADAIDITVGELMDPARADAWLSDAADGKTRTRNTLRGPDAAAYTNSMRVRIDSYNAFAEFLCLPDRLDSQPPARGFHLTPADTERLLHDLTVRRPVHANAATSLRTAALAAVVADTGTVSPRARPPQPQRPASGRRGTCRTRRRILSARRRDRADPHPVAQRPGGDHRRTRGQRPRLPVDPD